jgi:hypothetical protein
VSVLCSCTESVLLNFPTCDEKTRRHNLRGSAKIKNDIKRIKS